MVGDDVQEDEIFLVRFHPATPRLLHASASFSCFMSAVKKGRRKTATKLKDCHCRSLLSSAGIRLWRGLRWVSVSECWQVGCWRAYRTEWVHSAERRTVEWRNPEVARPQPVPRRTQRTDQTLRYAARAREDGFNSARGEPNNNSTHTVTEDWSIWEEKKREKKALKLVLRVNLHCILTDVHTSLASG